MVWSIIKVVYGVAVPLPNREDENGSFTLEKDFPELKGLVTNFVPERIRDLSPFSPNKDGLILMTVPGGMIGDGVAVGRRDERAGNFMNCWSSLEAKEPGFDYSCDNKEFDPYISRTGFVHYDFDHHFKCCSKSNGKCVIFGLVYDELERNLFMDEKFDSISSSVLNRPTTIDEVNEICPELFEHDSTDYVEGKRCRWKEHKTEKRSEPGKRFSELQQVEESKKKFVDEVISEYKFLQQFPVNSYLILDDCMSCT